MASETHPVAIVAAEAPAKTKPTSYPEPFASRMVGRLKRMWFISRSETARPATKAAIPTTTSRRRSSTGSGSSCTRMARPTETRRASHPCARTSTSRRRTSPGCRRRDSCLRRRACGLRSRDKPHPLQPAHHAGGERLGVAGRLRLCRRFGGDDGDGMGLACHAVSSGAGTRSLAHFSAWQRLSRPLPDQEAPRARAAGGLDDRLVVEPGEAPLEDRDQAVLHRKLVRDGHSAAVAALEQEEEVLR